MLTIFSMSAIVPTFASTAGRKNTAIGLTGATVYSALKGKNNTATVLLGLGAAQSWKSYEDSRKRDNKRKSYKHRCGRSAPRGHAYGHNKAKQYKHKNHKHHR